MKWDVENLATALVKLEKVAYFYDNSTQQKKSLMSQSVFEISQKKLKTTI